LLGQESDWIHGGGYERVQLARAHALAEVWRVVGDQDRRAFWLAEVARMGIILREIEAAAQAAA
jgi:hypothetical protein